MRKIAGVLLFLAGAGLGYGFHHVGSQGAAGATAAFRTLGNNFPSDAVFLLGALWGLGLGTWLIATRSDPSWRPMSTFFLVNSLLLLSSLAGAVIGARIKSNAGPAFAVFVVAALLQIATGLVLLVLAGLERPRGIVGLAVGGALYVAAAAVTLICFLGGGG